MLLPNRLNAIGFAAFLLLPLAGCASSANKSLQDALAADPRLKEKPVVLGSSPTSQPSPAKPIQPTQTDQIELPADFPAEVPLYPQRSLLAVEQPDQNLLTRWSSPDPSAQIMAFYRQELQKNGWKLEGQPIDPTQGILEASRETLQLRVNVQAGSEFTLQVEGLPASDASAPNTSAPNTSTPSPGSSEFIGPISPAIVPSPASSPVATGGFTDLDKAPNELQQPTRDLTQLGVLALPSSNKANLAKSQNFFEPNKAITRREYARWLVAVNNRLYASRPARHIRLAVETASPAFQDVTRRDRDFSAIQGLAEAGLLPSSLSGDSTATLFRPDAPLTREEMILWKMPVDMRQALPTATIDSVKQTWGFQDAARIESRALRAVLADFQNGDQSNLRRAFGYTTLFQPKRSVTRAEAAGALWYIGFQGDGISAQEALKGSLSKP